MSRHDILINTNLQCRVEGRSIRKRGRPKRNCMDEVYEWTGMSTRFLTNVCGKIVIVGINCAMHCMLGL